MSPPYFEMYMIVETWVYRSGSGTSGGVVKVGQGEPVGLKIRS